MTATAARNTLQSAIVGAVPLVAVYAMPPAGIAGPSVVIAPDGWAINTGTQVRYSVQVSCILNGQDTTQALADLESLAATVWLTAFAAGWSVGDMGAPETVTYADQPNLAMTFTASRIVTLAT